MKMENRLPTTGTPAAGQRGKKREREDREVNKGPQSVVEKRRKDVVREPKNPRETPKQRETRKSQDEEARKTLAPILRAPLSLPDWEDEETEHSEESPFSPSCVDSGEGAGNAVSPPNDATLASDLQTRQPPPGQPLEQARDRGGHASAEKLRDASSLSDIHGEKKRSSRSTAAAPTSEGRSEAGAPHRRANKDVFWKDPANRRILRGLAAVLTTTPTDKASSLKSTQKGLSGTRGERTGHRHGVSFEEERDKSAKKVTDWMSGQIDCRRRTRPALSKERLLRQKKRR
uniref:Uncharacterized protein n=1 Tax=Neospora caninum (strain Liverpool) TaxID=572307 RepID=A0A0F7UBZ1_NEOCL|nr:TPA: hypothetical protein BN1204_023535 [Neospora caninum Liverpool]